MLLVAHRMPDDPRTVAGLVAAGADVFEADVQLARSGIVRSHAVPLRPRIGALRRDGPRLSWARDPVGESLDAVRGRLPVGCRLLLDLKDDRDDVAFALAARVVAAGLDPARTLASSKHWPSLDRLAEAGLPVWRSVADRGTLRRLLAGVGAAPVGPPGSGLTIRHTYLTPERVRWLQRFGLVVAWTVNDAERAVRLAEWGVDGLTTDRPEVMRAVRARSSR